MNLLYALRCHDTSSLDNRRLSPLKAWMCAHASTSLEKYKHLLANGFDTPMVFEAETPQRQFVAYIDLDNKFCTEDKLSQVFSSVLLLLFVCFKAIPFLISPFFVFFR